MALDNRISLQKLEVFCLVVELGGVGRAAEHLYVAQPVVSAHLRTLQERVGAQLLYRDGQKMRLTEAGETAYEWAKEVMGRSHEMVREIEDFEAGDSGRVIVAASMSMGSYLLPPVMSQHLKNHPGAKMTLQVSSPEAALHAIEIGRVDFAVVITDIEIDQRLYETETIGQEDLVLVAAPDYDEIGDSVTAQELQSLPFVCAPRDQARRQIIDESLRSIGVAERDVIIELGHPEAMKQFARDGLGVGMFFRSSVEREIDSGALRVVDIDGARFEMPIVLVKRAGKRLTPLQQNLADAIRAACAGRVPQAP